MLVVEPEVLNQGGARNQVIVSSWIDLFDQSKEARLIEQNKGYLNQEPLDRLKTFGSIN